VNLLRTARGPPLVKAQIASPRLIRILSVVRVTDVSPR